jgi:hypothetical protein
MFGGSQTKDECLAQAADVPCAGAALEPPNGSARDVEALDWVAAGA